MTKQVIGFSTGDRVIKTGNLYEIDGIQHQVTKVDQTHGVLTFVNLDNCQNVPFKVTKFQQLIADQVAVRLDTSIQVKAAKEIVSDAAFDDIAKSEALKREKVVKAYRQLTTSHVRNEVAAQQVIEKFGIKCSTRTIRDWELRHRNYGLMGLIPKHCKKGRRPEALSDFHTQLLQETFEHNSGKRISVVAFVEQVEQRLLALGSKEKITKTNIRKWWEEQPFEDKVIAKFDPRVQRAIASARKKAINIVFPYQRIEMDCTQLDNFVFEPVTMIPFRPYVICAIDTASGAVLAVVFTIRNPDTTAVMKCLELAMYGYDEEYLKKLGVVNPVRPVGTPHTIVVDNGSEFRAEAFSNLSLFGITVEANEAYAPYQKPFVERFNRTLCDYFKNFPGSTHNPLKPEEPDTEHGMNSCQMTLDQLNDLATKYLFDVFNCRESSRLAASAIASKVDMGVSPSTRMQYMQERMMPSEPIPKIDFIRTRMKTVSRALQAEGITLENCKFASDKLVELFKVYGPSKRLQVRYDELDCSYVEVVDPADSKNLILAKNIHWDGCTSDTITFKEFTSLRNKVINEYREVTLQGIKDQHARWLKEFFDTQINTQKTHKERTKALKAKEKRDAVTKAAENKAEAAVSKTAETEVKVPAKKTTNMPVVNLTDLQADDLN